MHRVRAPGHGSKLDDAVAGRFRRQANSDIVQAAPSITFDSATPVIPVTSIPVTTTPRAVITTAPNFPSSSSVFRCTTCDGPSNSSSSSTTALSIPSTSSSTPASITSSSLSTTQTQSSTSTTPTITDGPQLVGPTSQKVSAVGIALGVSLGCLLLIATTVCCVLIRRRRRGRRAKQGELKVEKPFGEEAGFHLVVDTGPSPTSITPFSALPSVPPQLSPLSNNPPSPLGNGKSAKSFVDPPASNSAASDSGTNSEFNGSLAGTATMTNQQNLLDQLSALRAQIQQVEALARTQGLNPSSSTTPAATTEDGSEPPPEYDASMRAAGQGLVRDGKTSS